MTKPKENWKKALRDEFAIHFKNSPDEFGFLEVFIDDLADQILKEIIKEHETSIKLEGEDEIYCDWYKCLKCGDSMITNGSKYCPNCGRKIKSKLKNIKE